MTTVGDIWKRKKRQVERNEKGKVRLITLGQAVIASLLQAQKKKVKAAGETD